MLRRALVGLVAVFCSLSVAGVGVGTAAADPVTCQNTYHARPSATGWYADPCAFEALTFGDGLRISAAVEFYWVVNGSTRSITHARYAARIYDPNDVYGSIYVDEVRLGRYSPYSGVIISTLSGTGSSGANVLVQGPPVSGVGCGGGDNPTGSGSYPLLTHAFFSWDSSNTDLYSNVSYFWFAADGTC